MRYVGGYLKKRILYVLLIVVLFILEALVTFVGPDNEIDLGYLLLLQSVIAFVFMGVDFARFLIKTRKVEYNLNRDPKEALALPEAEDAMDEAYQALLEYQMMDRNRIFVQVQKDDERMKEYYNVWVHQIKTPISAMKLLLQTGFDPEDENAAYEFRADMERELFAVEQYANMALQYQRLHSESTDYSFAPVSLDKVIRDAVRKYAQFFVKKKLTLEYEGTDRSVITDEKWISFVFEQLLSNAIKYTPSGTIRILVVVSGAFTEVAIADEGIGIKEEDLPRVFEKGYTGYNGRADKTSTGIGLFLCKEILTRLNHSIRIESAPQKGTTVWVRFHNLTSL